MSAAPEPFLLLEPEAAPRLEPVQALLPNAEPVRWLRSPILAGASILGAGIPVLWATWLVSALFDRWGALGWVGLVILVCGISLIGVGIVGELRGLLALRRVDQLRVEFASGEAERVQRGTALAARATAALGDLAGSGRCRHSGNSNRALAFWARTSSAGCNGSAWTDRRSSERRDRCGDPVACNGRTDR